MASKEYKKGDTVVVDHGSPKMTHNKKKKRKIHSVHKGTFYAVHQGGSMVFVPAHKVSDPDNDGDNDTPGAGGDTDNDASASDSADIWTEIADLLR